MSEKSHLLETTRVYCWGCPWLFLIVLAFSYPWLIGLGSNHFTIISASLCSGSASFTYVEAYHGNGDLREGSLLKAKNCKCIAQRNPSCLTAPPPFSHIILTSQRSSTGISSSETSIESFPVHPFCLCKSTHCPSFYYPAFQAAFALPPRFLMIQLLQGHTVFHAYLTNDLLFLLNLDNVTI